MPEVVPITKYVVKLLNHKIGWEFIGVRLNSFNDLLWGLKHRFLELKEEVMAAPRDNPLVVDERVRKMDLIVIAMQYLEVALADETPLPNPGYGKSLIVQVGPGVVVMADCMVGIGNLPCFPMDIGHN